MAREEIKEIESALAELDDAWGIPLDCTVAEICEQVAMCTGKTKDFWALNTSRNAKSFFSLEKNK